MKNSCLTRLSKDILCIFAMDCESSSHQVQKNFSCLPKVYSLHALNMILGRVLTSYSFTAPLATMMESPGQPLFGSHVRGSTFMVFFSSQITSIFLHTEGPTDSLFLVTVSTYLSIKGGIQKHPYKRFLLRLLYGFNSYGPYFSMISTKLLNFPGYYKFFRNLIRFSN